MSAFFIWKSIPSVKKIECNDKICIKLCDVVSQKQIIKPPSKPKAKPKKITKAKLEPILVQKVIQEEFIKEPEVIEEKKEVSQTMEVVIAKSVAVEDTMTKQKRVKNDYLQKHIAEIQRLLQENLYYPRRAREREIVGEVRIEFTLSTDAKAHSIKVISSNSEILSRAAVKTIEDLSGKFPKPKEELTITVPMTYSLIKN
ncbi:energy transducer TonB [Sulfurimonas sp.]|uniref:energy transducer TonB n=1 Tax=Sulfurimonas sp. TaxID=2022749 RepID=UPI002B49531C|nr:energy transducer TonB [Sulfurimonas sp.]